MKSWRFNINRINAGIANVGYCKNHDLRMIRRVGEDFLVAGVGCIENSFTKDGAVPNKLVAFENCPVLKQEVSSYTVFDRQSVSPRYGEGGCI